MKKLLATFLFLFTFVFVLFVPTKAYGNSGYQNENEGTDRVIVKITDALGDKTIKSITWEEFESTNESVHVASGVFDSQKVEMLEPDYNRYTGSMTGSLKVKSWGTERIGAKAMQEKLTIGKNNIIVAVIDTGVDYTHSLLKNSVVSGYDFVDNDTDPMDAHYHGSHVAGILADSTPENVKIMPIRALDDKGIGYDSNIACSG